MKKVFNANGSANKQGWNHNTDLDVDLKTILHSDRRMKTGKEYRGVLRLDADAEIEEFRCRDAHYTFLETLTSTGKRYPQIFNGKYISITRQDDGNLRPNFKQIKINKGFNVVQYASSVANELLWALEGLLEER